MKHKFSYLLFFVLAVFVFFGNFFLKGNLPIPSDTIIGLYHPFRDFYEDQYPRGLPFKNFAITDPVRQQYPWKELAVSMEKRLSLPIWNPYSFSGSPLIANFQSGAFYPLNILFFILPFYLSWSLLIIAQPFLGGIFLYLYLKNQGIGNTSSLLGAVTFAFCGFSISWMEWGNVFQTGLWLPLILLSIDKISSTKKNRNWILVLFIALTSSFFAGHLQLFFYTFLVSFFYLAGKVYKGFRKLTGVLAAFGGFVAVTAVQWIPTLQLILLSGRNIDQDWRDAGWFVPWEHLVQLLVPDFFGNPSTLNYWGTWNYGEFIAYVGVLPLVMAVYALFFKKDKKVFFFGSLFFIALIFALPTIFAKIPYKFSFPFISTSQPTRLMFIVDFSLSVLASIGFEQFLKSQDKKRIIYTLLFFLASFAGLWFFVLQNPLWILVDNIVVSKNNLILPTLSFLVVSFLILSYVFLARRIKFLLIILPLLMVLVVFLDLFRFGAKYLTFSKKEYLYPQTKVLEYLQKDKSQFRIMSTDSRIFPPNFSSVYKIQSIDGYDPLYILRYAEYSASLGRGVPDIHRPFGFNRIITPQNYRSPLVDLLNVKYVLTLGELEPHPKLVKVFQEGETTIYRNRNVIPRVFFVSSTYAAKDKNDAIEEMYKSILSERAVVEGVGQTFNRKWSTGSARLNSYSENSIIIETDNKKEGFLVLSEVFYPTWKVQIDSKPSEIYLTDFTLRGVVVPKGKHIVEFYTTLF